MLSNVVLIKKANEKWRMCVGYTDLNKACPKDAFPLPSVDKLVDNSLGFQLFSFMDAYLGYNQIPIYLSDQEKIAFMTPKGNYCYRVMPFELKNVCKEWVSDHLGPHLDQRLQPIQIKRKESVNSG